MEYINPPAMTAGGFAEAVFMTFGRQYPAYVLSQRIFKRREVEDIFRVAIEVIASLQAALDADAAVEIIDRLNFVSVWIIEVDH